MRYRLWRGDMADAPRMKPWIDAIHPYVPGRSTGAGGRPLVKLSANENPFGCSPLARAALADGNAQGNPALYPDPDARALREGIARLHGIDLARIVCGTGSGELLHCAVQAFAGQGDEVLFPEFSFSLYPLLAHKVGATPVLAPMADYRADVGAMLARITPRTRVILLDNPNNPCGSYLGADEIARLIEQVPADVLLVIDQAYGEYLAPAEDDGALAACSGRGNLLVMRTFSKAYGLAAERIGWATGAPPLIDALNRLRGAFNVSASGQRAALAALADQAFVARSRAETAAARTALVDTLAALGNYGLRTVPSGANFVLVLFEGSLGAADALAALEEGGYAVRHLPGQGLPHALRITIGTREQMGEIGRILADAASRAG